MAKGFLPRVTTLSAPTDSWPLQGVRQVSPKPNPSHFERRGVSVTWPTMLAPKVPMPLAKVSDRVVKRLGAADKIAS